MRTHSDTDPRVLDGRVEDDNASGALCWYYISETCRSQYQTCVAKVKPPVWRSNPTAQLLCASSVGKNNGGKHERDLDILPRKSPVQ
jgi:hypothetical protein